MASPGYFYCQIPELDSENAIDSIGGSAELFDKICRQVIRRIPDNISAMDKALAPDGDLLSFAITVHGLKSSLRQIGYRPLASLAEALENEAKDEKASTCRGLYDEFKEKLQCFYHEASALIREADAKSDSDHVINEKNLAEFKALLEHTKAALEEYDTLDASEILSPLSGYRFGGQADEELSMALSDIEVFQPLAALVHITNLLDLCGGPSEAGSGG